eukprot:CAMPEP_0170574082 /NCGR_PEP_ID=MMETSP0224-20130122/3109_1 /TAXON_ID=285029 /ORGANISM="Togula jolla, Strain CCCM 725" /LENGTH=73 /DNA_ID=CAMNT_0010896713 /DNA_START=159 /DNA_END=380 /DNA_ORIENTATION=-
MPKRWQVTLHCMLVIAGFAAGAWTALAGALAAMRETSGKLLSHCLTHDVGSLTPVKSAPNIVQPNRWQTTLQS